MKKLLGFLAFLIWLTLWVTVLPAAAQSQPALSLSLSRDFGYSSGTGQIQGTFSLRATGPDTLSRVEFFLDGNSIGEVDQAPFNLRFSTDSYAHGVHTLQAVGYTGNGQELRSNEIRAEFVSAQEGYAAALKIAVPILIVVLIAVLASTLGPALLGRGRKRGLSPGAPRNYGAMGGAICPKCGRPFGMHFLALNMLTGKLDRCPYCGKWSIVQRASPDKLRLAEAAELEQAKGSEQVPAMSEEEKLRKELEDSRFQDT